MEKEMSMRVSGPVSWKMLESMDGSGQPTLNGMELREREEVAKGLYKFDFYNFFLTFL